MKKTKNHRQNRTQPLSKPALYGLHAVREAWLNPDRLVQSLYLTSAGEKSFADTLNAAQNQKLRRPNPVMLDKKDFEKLLPKGAVHQGIAIACSPLEEVFLSDLVRECQAQPHSLILMLDQVTDPHNVGAILRSASALGASGVVMQRKHAPELTGVLAKTACGGLEHIPVVYETNLARAIETLKTDGFFVYGLDERGAQDIGALKPAAHSVLVLGAEGDGMRRLIREGCDELVRLPTLGPIQSLNVSNAAAVALYALKRSI